MNASYTVEANAYERIAINLADLIDSIGSEVEDDLHRLLASAYRAAYLKAAEKTARQATRNNVPMA